MSTTPVYSVSNPVSGQQYTAPSSSWAVATGGTSVTCTVQAFDGSGNLLVVSSMTAYIVTETGGSVAGSYTYNGGNTVQATITAAGGTTYAPSGKVSQSGVAKLQMYLTYTGSAYDQPPNTPSNLAPSNSSTVSSTTPTFTGSFSDPTSGDYLSQYEIAVNNAASGGGAQVWDSGSVSASTSEKNNAQFSRGYGGGTALSFGATYSWRARVGNQHGNWSGWSGWQTFSVVQAPSAPSVSAPSGLVNTETPGWSFTYASPQGTAMASYHYTITDQGSGALIYDNGSVSASLASGATLSGSVPSGAGLVAGAAYFFTLTTTDSNGATSPSAQAAFTTAALPTAAPSSPVGGASVTTQTPTFTWAYSDPNYTQANYEVVVTNTTTGATLWDSGKTAGTTQSVVCGVSIPYNTHISWQVQVWDTAGLQSGYSASATAYVVNGPSTSITSPTNNSTITTNTPTVTWSYTAGSGGYAQASASVVLMDSHGNSLASYSVTGTGTSYTLPAGVLANSTTFRVSVTVTDSNSVSGTSAANTFTLSYTAPADLQGQSLGAAVNYAVSPYLNTDANADGVADNWSYYTSGTNATLTLALDPAVTQSAQLASGDGFVTGAQELSIVAKSASQFNEICLRQDIHPTTAGFTIGSTALAIQAMVRVQATSGTPYAVVGLVFQDSSYTTIGSEVMGGTLSDTAGQFVLLQGPQGVVIPANTAHIFLSLHLQSNGTDTGSAWFYGAQLEAAAANDAHFIAGDLGTGYSYDSNGYAHRALVTGSAPTLAATPGANTDALGAPGGMLTLAWDTALAATSGFYAYLVERRRMDQQTDDSAWSLLATLTNSTQGNYTDYTAGSTTVYQYAVRQQITYPDGSVGLSAHRAIVAGAVDFSPAWYLTSMAGSILNLRLTTLGVKRKLIWKERAVYSAYLGRVGTARDAGPAAGYSYTLEVGYNATWGDNLQAVRRLWVQLQQAGGTYNLKDPDGLVVPITLGDVSFPQEDTRSDTLLSLSVTCLQAGDTEDY